MVAGLMIVASMSAWSVGGQIYKYRDDNGRLVYTDKKPAKQDYDKQELVVTEQQSKVTVVNRGSREKPRLYVVNELHGPAQVWLQMNHSENVGFQPRAPDTWVVNGPGEQFLGAVVPLDANRSWAYQWLPRHVPGEPLDEANLRPMTLSVPCKGGRYVVSQAFGGDASHSDHAESWHAVDIEMPVGTPIYAVRDGTVMDLERNFSRSGWREEYADEANYVRLLHDDGTMAVYAHLSPRSIQVRLGQSVTAGQRLGHSGNTGFSTGPHLHFVIQYNVGKKLKSLPFQFAGFKREPEVGDVLGKANAKSHER